MSIQSNHHYRLLPSPHVIRKALVISTVLVFGTGQSMAAVESIISDPVDQLPQNIRTQLVQATGGATITDVHVDRNHGDPRYVAHYRDPTSNEMRTVTLGQMGNTIVSGAFSNDAEDTAVGGASGMKPDRVTPLPSDGPIPVNPPQRPVAPVMPDTPTVANSTQEAQSEQGKKPVVEDAIPRRKPSVTTDNSSTNNSSTNNSSTNNSAKPFGIPPKEEDRDRNKSPVPSPRKFDNNGPDTKKASDQK